MSIVFTQSLFRKIEIEYFHYFLQFMTQLKLNYFFLCSRVKWRQQYSPHKIGPKINNGDFWVWALALSFALLIFQQKDPSEGGKKAMATLGVIFISYKYKVIFEIAKHKKFLGKIGFSFTRRQKNLGWNWLFPFGKKSQLQYLIPLSVDFLPYETGIITPTSRGCKN